MGDIRIGIGCRQYCATIFVSTMLIYFAFLPKLHGFATVQNNDGSSFADFNGALRLNGAYRRERADYFVDRNSGMNMTVIRFISAGTVKDRMDFELDLFGAFGSGQTDSQRSLSNASFTRSTYRYHLFSDSHYKDSTFSGYGLDRMILRLNGEKMNVSIGRMPINYSIAGVFAVNDFFAPFFASSINTVYKPGVDAVKFAVQTGNLSNIELVGVAGNSADSDTSQGHGQLSQSALLLYAHTLLGPLDITFLGGRLAGKWMVGGAVQSDVGLLTIYSEGHVGFLDKDNPLREEDEEEIVAAQYLQVTGGARVMFNRRNATMTIEYAYLSNGTSPSHYLTLLEIRQMLPDELPYPGKHYGSFLYAMELHPLLTFHFLSMLNVTDLSGLFSMSLVLSLGDNAEWIIGALAPFGKKSNIGDNNSYEIHSEYGDAPFTTYTELRYYF